MRRARAPRPLGRARRRNAACRPRFRRARRASTPNSVAARDAASTCSARVETERDRRIRAPARPSGASFAHADHLVADQNVAHAAAHQRFGLADLLAALADGAGGDLLQRDRRALVRLRMRAQPHARRARERRHVCEGCARRRRDRRSMPACRSRRPARRSGRGCTFIVNLLAKRVVAKRLYEADITVSTDDVDRARRRHRPEANSDRGAMSEMPTIRVVDVHKRFGALEVLKGVSFDVHRGNVVSMIGASGSGKSTLLRCINHLETPDLRRYFHRGRVAVLSRRRGGRAASRGRWPKSTGCGATSVSSSSSSICGRT